MDLDEIFEPLLSGPLAAMQTPSKPEMVVLDALDELPKGPPRNKMLRAITQYFSKLPPWTKEESEPLNAAGLLPRRPPRELDGGVSAAGLRAAATNA